MNNETNSNYDLVSAFPKYRVLTWDGTRFHVIKPSDQDSGNWCRWYVID